MREYKTSFGSAHAHVWQVAMCDGSVQARTFSIDPLVHQRAGNRRDSPSTQVASFTLSNGPGCRADVQEQSTIGEQQCDEWPGEIAVKSKPDGSADRPSARVEKEHLAWRR